MACKRSFGYLFRQFFYHIRYGWGVLFPCLKIQIEYLHELFVFEQIKPIEINGGQLDFVIEELFNAHAQKDPSKYSLHPLVLEVVTKVVDEACSQACMTLVRKISLRDLRYNTELFGSILINGTIAKSLE